MNLDDYFVNVEGSEFPCVRVRHDGCPLLYADGKLIRAVKKWLTTNVGPRHLRYEDFQQSEGACWVALQGIHSDATVAELANMSFDQQAEWRRKHLTLFFYFKRSQDAVLFKLTWGGGAHA